MSEGDNPPAVRKRDWPGLMGSVLNGLLALVFLALGIIAYMGGIFHNYVFSALLVAALWKPFELGWKAWRKKLYYGLFSRPLSRESRPYFLQFLVRVVFYGSCAVMFQVALVPLQFSKSDFNNVRALQFVMLAFLIGVSLLPPKRRRWSMTVFMMLVSLFLAKEIAGFNRAPADEVTVLAPPFHGVSFIVQGGNSPIINHHYIIPSQRDAVDIQMIAHSLERFRNDQWSGDNMSEPVYSPCTGKVVDCIDIYPDNAIGHPDLVHIAGNTISIQVATNKFVMMAHLMQRSLLVKVGDTVTAGQQVASCGNSGNTTIPHVHLQVQDHPRFMEVTRTYPFAFQRILRRHWGRETVLDSGIPRRNDLILN